MFIRRSTFKERGDKIIKGFTLVEIVIVLSIVAILTFITFISFLVLNKTQALDEQTKSIVSVIERARSLTLGAKDDTPYGVHFETTKIVLFKGNTYVPINPSNITENLNYLTTLSLISLTGSTSNIVFSRLWGSVSATGTVRLSLKSNNLASSTVIIYDSGLTEVK